MNEYQSLTQLLLNKTMRHVQLELKPFTALVVDDIGEHQLWALEDMVGRILKTSALHALRENSAQQRTANNFGLVHRMPTTLRNHIHALARQDGYYLDYQSYAEVCWSQERMKARAAGTYFSRNKVKYYENAIVFYFLLYATLDTAREYLFPDLKTSVKSLERDFPKQEEWQ